MNRSRRRSNTCSTSAARLAAAVMCPATALWWALPATAMQDAAPPPTATVGSAATATDRESRLAADALSRCIIRLARIDGEQEVEFYRALALLVEVLLRLDPGAEEARRLQLEAIAATGDREWLTRASRQLLLIDPKDTVIQLRLINDRVRALPDADQRLAVYERLMGPAGASLDAAVRSRLALDAALLSRENGDDAAFVERLTLATTLDPTNKDAAALFAVYFLDRTSDPRERVELLANVMLADPLDLEAHVNLSHELMAYGAYKGARRFLDAMSRLYIASGIQPPDDRIFDVLLAMWNAEGGERVTEELDSFRRELTAQEEARRQSVLASGRDPGPPRPIRFSTQIEMLRLAVELSRDNDAGVQSAMADLSSIYAEASTALAAIPEGMTAEQAMLAERAGRLELAWARLWSNTDIDAAEAAVEGLAAEQGATVSADALARFRGWVAARRGDTARARELLEPVAARDSLARMGMGLVEELENQPSLAARHYARVALDERMTALGTYARLRVEKLLGAPLNPTPVERDLEKYAASLAPWLEAMVTDPASYMAMTVDPVESSPGPEEAVVLRLTLKNVGRWPLSTGSMRPVPTRFMVSPALMVSGRSLTAEVKPEVFDLTRRLRLMPGESVTAVLRPTLGGIGDVIDAHPFKRVSMRWRAIQGFMIDPSGQYGPGMLCLSAQTPILVREPFDSEVSAQALADRIGGAEGEALMHGVAHAAALLRDKLRPGALLPGTEDRRVLVEALEARFQRMTERERAWTIAHMWLLPTFEGDEGATMALAARADRSPAVRAAVLCLLAITPDDPVFASIDDQDDPVIREAAVILRGVLSTPESPAEGAAAAPAAPSSPARGTPEGATDAGGAGSGGADAGGADSGGAGTP